jgi:spore germination cell wall hydrolase CwlJ-like protein
MDKLTSSEYAEAVKRAHTEYAQAMSQATRVYIEALAPTDKKLAAARSANKEAKKKAARVRKQSGLEARQRRDSQLKALRESVEHP